MARACAILRSGGLRLPSALAVGALAALLAAELAVRAFGLVDFPLYETDRRIGYIYRPNQQGAFLNRNRWAVNDQRMPTPRRWEPERRPNLLVIGNSIVAGGNPYSTTERLESLLGRLLADRFTVWPVAVGGWSTVNEIAYLESQPEVVAAASLFVWSHVGGGLDGLSTWLGDDVFPRERPHFASAYIVRRYVLRRLPGSNLPAFAEPVFDAVTVGPAPSYADNVERFDAAMGALATASGRRIPGVLLLYPTMEQLAVARAGREWLRERADLEAIAARHGAIVVDLTRYPEWTPAAYRDSIHPTTDGNLVLARILLGASQRALEE